MLQGVGGNKNKYLVWYGMMECKQNSFIVAKSRQAYYLSGTFVCFDGF